MAKAPLPAFLPGNFATFVKDDLGFTLIVHDSDKSSWRLGEDMQRITALLKKYRNDDLLLRAVDAAREFGAAQAVFKKRLVIPLKARAQQPQIDFKDFDEDDGTANKRLTNLPQLRNF
jgi:hypothetical protein